VGIARAIALSPRLLVLDEPTSALDVSVQAVILHLLADLRERLAMTYLFVSHDLNVVRLFSDRVMVMYLGRVAELGRADRVFEQPRHPYTRALLSAVPLPRSGARRARVALAGEPRSPVDPSPHVCRFHGRCPEGFDRCEREMPALRPVGDGHEAACHRADAADVEAVIA
jgi:peptide/nickel transport system ATP-binding protein